MTAALKVSPAPSVSTRVSGGKASECTSSPSGPTASAPASAQAQISVALGGGRWGVGGAAVLPFPHPDPHPVLPRLHAVAQPPQRLGGRAVPEVLGHVLADEHLRERGWDGVWGDATPPAERCPRTPRPQHTPRDPHTPTAPTAPLCSPDPDSTPGPPT